MSKKSCPLYSDKLFACRPSLCGACAAEFLLYCSLAGRSVALQEENGAQPSKLGLPTQMSRTLRLEYRLPYGGSNADCLVVASWLGDFLMISAKAADKALRIVSLEGRHLAHPTGAE